MSVDIISGTEAAYTVPKWPSQELPFISCKCITYGRTDLLVESLYSFLIQDYPKDKCELVIVNDYPLQKLHYPHPQVKIYNLRKHNTNNSNLNKKSARFATEIRSILSTKH